MTPDSALQGSESGLASLIGNYRRLTAQSVPLVMATVIETLGSTYRKAGARMLISADGSFHGLIGGGCFEGDLYEQTRAVFESSQPRVLFYDMRAPEDALWGLGLGCNGAVRILLQRLDASGDDPTVARLESILNADEPAVLATCCSGNHAGESCRLLPGSAGNSDPDAATWQEPFRAEARAVAALQQSGLVTHRTEAGAFSVFYDYIRPRPRLLLIGAGADALPVLHVARQLDWHVLLIDHRPAYAVSERFPGAEAVTNAHPPELDSAVGNRRVDAVVLMTHNIDYDARFLEQLVDLPCRYLGLLGPTARRERLFELAAVDPAAFADRLHAPVGLDIGGAAPESIALAVVTEIHAVLHERDARPLRDKQLPIQIREPAN